MATKTASYLVSAGALIAAFGAGTVTGSGLTAKAAISEPKKHEIRRKLTAGERNALGNFINNNVCPTVDTELGLTGDDTCDALGNRWSVTFTHPEVDDPDTDMRAAFSVPGTWVAGAPQ